LTFSNLLPWTIDYRLPKIAEQPQARNPQTGHIAGLSE